MKILKKFNDVCESCCEEHEIWLVEDDEETIFKNEVIHYKARYYYCQFMDEYYEDEELMRINQRVLKDKDREMVHLLTSQDIIDIRKKYMISQKDLSKLLGLSPVTITRYENYQIQDKAHDVILRKLSEDPSWFIELLHRSENLFSSNLYNKYFKNAKQLLDKKISINETKRIYEVYQSIDINKYCGHKTLNLNKVCDVINYLCSQIEDLYKVKLMKLLWYCDSLYFKYYHYSITGLAYKAEQMGALPICHNEIISLPNIHYETIEFDEGYGYKFYVNDEYTCHLTKKEKEIINKVILTFKNMSRKEIVEKMHNEDAYKLTSPKELIKYDFVKTLSID